VPLDLELDTFEGRTYLSVVALRSGDASLFGKMPTFLQPTFPLIAFRTYVKRRDPSGVDRHGTVLLKEIAPYPGPTMTDRLLRKSNVEREPVTANIFAGSKYLFWWGRIADNNWLEASVSGEPEETTEDSFAEFIFEREWNFVPVKKRRTLQYKSEHPRWNFWRASDFAARINARHILTGDLTRSLSRPADCAFVAQGSRVRIGFPALAAKVKRSARSQSPRLATTEFQLRS
jgi:hypothetical protein